MTTVKTSAQTAKRKSKQVDELVDMIKASKGLLIASVKGLKGASFQDIRKKIRAKASIKIYKKNIVLKAIEKIQKGGIIKLKDYVVEDCALLFSNVDVFELSAILAENRSPAKAKAGQESPEDIQVKAGPTELLPGPAISQLGAVGLKVMVEDGKIAIREDKIIVKKGDKISDAAADIMGKLDIKPFKIGFTPLVAYDVVQDKLYLDVKVEKEKEIENLKYAASRALAFAFKLGIVTKDTLGLLIGKADAEEKAITRLIKIDNGGS